MIEEWWCGKGNNFVTSLLWAEVEFLFLILEIFHLFPFLIFWLIEVLVKQYISIMTNNFWGIKISPLRHKWLIYSLHCHFHIESCRRLFWNNIIYFTDHNSVMQHKQSKKRFFTLFWSNLHSISMYSTSMTLYWSNILLRNQQSWWQLQLPNSWRLFFIKSTDPQLLYYSVVLYKPQNHRQWANLTMIFFH